MIPHSQPTISGLDAKSVSRVIKTGALAQGKKVSSFENQFARFHGLRHAAATNSCTSALHLTLLALNIGKGDEVIMPNYVCSAVANAVHSAGAKVVLAEVNPLTFNIDPYAAAKKITKRTKAIIVPHMFGYPADIKNLKRLKIPIIEDCAQAVGAKINKKLVGTFGVVSVFSFYATKMMTTGEGGMVLSSNQALINRIKDLRDYDGRKDYKHRFNYKMTDFQAAMGISQLKSLKTFIKKRKNIAAIYTNALKGSSFSLPIAAKNVEPVYYRFVFGVPSAKAIIKKMSKKGVQCAQPVFKPLNEYLGRKGFSVSKKLMKTLVSVPIYPNLSQSVARQIIKDLTK